MSENRAVPPAGKPSRGHMINGRFITERENFNRLLENKRPYWVPKAFDMCAIVGGNLINENGGWGVGGKDDYGVTWVATDSAGGGTTPDPYGYIMDSVTQWREIYKPIDLEAIDWEGNASRDLADVDREANLVMYNMFEGFFQRFMAFEGFENCLCDLVEEPEECRAFFEAMCDERIALVEKLAKHYKPDIIMMFDDVAHHAGLFMSPEVFRDIIKPCYKRLYDAVRAHGIIVQHHCCGKCEEIVPDFIECGARLWQPAEPLNDLARLQREYGDKLIIEGGFATVGAHLIDTENAEAHVRAEACRCMREYAPAGNYMFSAMLMGPDGDALTAAADEEYRKLCMYDN